MMERRREESRDGVAELRRKTKRIELEDDFKKKSSSEEE